MESSRGLEDHRYGWLPLTVSGSTPSMTHDAQSSLNRGTGVWTPI
jgi:hypothetical protein